jgi:hypothetical protein
MQRMAFRVVGGVVDAGRAWSARHGSGVPNDPACGHFGWLGVPSWRRVPRRGVRRAKVSGHRTALADETRAAAETSGARWEPHGSEAVIDRLIDEYGRPGRAGGGGFYSYVDDKRAALWTGLAEAFTRPGRAIPIEDIRDRLLFVEVIDGVRCIDEGVLRSAADANVGSILGIGFPRWTGGVIQYINGYPGGIDAFVTRANELARQYGSRLDAPPGLVQFSARAVASQR